MTPNPVPPQASPPAEPPHVAQARLAVSVPALVLLALSALGIANALLGFVTAATSARQIDEALGPLFSDPAIRKDLGFVEGWVRTMANPLWNLPSLLFSSLTFAGAWQMRQLRRWPWAMGAAVLSAIPCLGGCCCLFGTPVGIWAATVLAKPEVKNAFRD